MSAKPKRLCQRTARVRPGRVDERRSAQIENQAIEAGLANLAEMCFDLGDARYVELSDRTDPDEVALGLDGRPHSRAWRWRKRSRSPLAAPPRSPSTCPIPCA
jgi:hypothetical protein